MVGTSATVAPSPTARRACLQADRISAMVLKICISLSLHYLCIVQLLVPLKLTSCCRRKVIALAVAGQGVRCYVLTELRDTVAEQLRCISITTNELCCRRERQVEQVVEHQNLSITVRPGSDA